MSATNVIEEIKPVTAAEQAEVIPFALQLARTPAPLIFALHRAAWVWGSLV